VVLGLLTPSFDLMSEPEAKTLMRGKYRGDQRRLDDWTLPDSIDWSPPGGEDEEED
jgi:hypothetical protein